MTSRLRGWLEGLGDLFWLRPAFLVTLGVLLGELMARAELAGIAGGWASAGWIYAGGEAGARALLGAVATSTIGVAGTVFSITVAALSLASGQMGPRLLRHFIRDPGNQWVLGIFLGTFAYALMLLRAVRSVQEQAFVPHLGITGALVLALLCVGALVWFVHHIANSINIDTVIGLVHAELMDAVTSLEQGEEADRPGVAATEAGVPAVPLRYPRAGFLRTLDEDALADWAASYGAVLRLHVRPGDYLFPGAAVGEVLLPQGPAPDEAGRSAEEAFEAAALTGERQAAVQDLEFAVRQMVEVAVRALSPGINDPFTAMVVLDRLGATLCEVAVRRMPAPLLYRGDRSVLWRHVTDYDGLCDAMFHMIRQNSGGSAAVLIRMVDTLRRVHEVERDPGRRTTLRRHAGLVLALGRMEVKDAAGLADLEVRGARMAAA